MQKIILFLVLLTPSFSALAEEEENWIEQAPFQEKYDFGFYVNNKLVSPYCIIKGPSCRKGIELTELEACIDKFEKVPVGRVNRYKVAGNDQDYVVYGERYYPSPVNMYEMLLYRYDDKTREYHGLEIDFGGRGKNHWNFTIKLEIKDGKLYCTD